MHLDPLKLELNIREESEKAFIPSIYGRVGPPRSRERVLTDEVVLCINRELVGYRSRLNGRQIVNVLPLPSVLSTPTLPLCILTISLTM
jgi:hypothetical protein